MDRIDIYNDQHAEIHAGDETITVTSPTPETLRSAAILKARTLGYAPTGQNRMRKLPIKTVICSLAIIAISALSAIGGWSLHDVAAPKPAAPAPKIIAHLTHSNTLAGANLYTCRTGKNGKGITCSGLNEHGQLGTPNSKVSNNKITELENKPITHLATSRATTCAATSDTVYCWGKNHAGQATGKPSQQAARPTPVLSGKGEITALTTGATHTCAATTNGLYCWGDTSKGQITTPGTTLTPTKITLPENINDQITTLTTSGYLTWAQTKTGKLIAFGNNQNQEIAEKEKAEHIEPAEIK